MIRNLILRQQNSKKLAIIENDKHISFCDLCKKSQTIANLLPKKAQNIAIFLPNGSDYIAAVWGVFACGQVAFPLSITLTKHEVLPLLKQAEVETIVTNSDFCCLFDLQQFNIIAVDKVTPKEINSKTALRKEIFKSSDEPMLLISTSGTTENIKIVQLSEKNVFVSVLGYLEKLRFDKVDINLARYIVATPFTSAYGIMILSVCLLMSFPLIVASEAFTLEALYLNAKRHDATHFEGGSIAIFLMEQMSDKAEQFDDCPLKYFGFGGSKVSGETIKNAKNIYKNFEFHQGYGMSEASPLITKHPQRVPLKKFDSVGTAIKGIKIAIKTLEGITQKPHEKGEILVKGSNVMLGYYKNKTETDSIIKDGYLHTGDIGYLDEAGYLYICGRKKSIVIVRGFNVNAEEVEECILRGSLAKECIVYGQMDENNNEILCAKIVPFEPSINISKIKEYLSLHLASYKIPQKIQFVDKIQKTATGKTRRNG